jgi:hypothetical protein
MESGPCTQVGVCAPLAAAEFVCMQGQQPQEHYNYAKRSALSEYLVSYAQRPLRASCA